MSPTQTENEPASRTAAEAQISLDRDGFLRDLLRELSGTLEDVVGLEDAAGFVSVVGTSMGRQIGQAYRQAMATGRLSREQVAEVLVDLKRRIEGGFSVEAIHDDRIVLRNNACPFGEKVVDRPSLCMMTSNVFGTISAEDLGYAKVELQETIAAGDPGCRIVIHLDRAAASDAPGREYFRTS